jgi:hypothetical protein
MRIKVTSQKERLEGRTPSSLERVVKSLNGQLKFSEGELPISHGPLDLVDQQKG